MRIGSNIKKSSDKSYLTKYRLSEGETALTQNIFSEWGSIYKNVSVDLFKFQSLSDEYKTYKLPFIRPLIQAKWNNLGNKKRKRNNTNKLTLTSVTRTNNQNVDSLHFERLSEKKHIFKGFLIKDITKFNFDSYASNGTSNGKKLVKFFPQIGYGIHYPLLSRENTNTLLLEPRIQLFLSPDDYKNYKIRNEDSLEVDLSSSNLFDINRYSGLDRVESGVRANYGVLFKRIRQNGSFISSTLGRTYNNNRQQLFNKDSGFQNKSSELVGNFVSSQDKYNLSYDFRLSNKLKLNRNSLEASAKLKKNEFNLSYTQLKSFASARHQDTEQINFGLTRRITNSWKLNFSQVRDLAGAKYSSPTYNLF